MDKQNTISKHIGILCAMPEEVGSILNNLKNIKIKTYGDLEIYSGKCAKYISINYCHV